MRLAHSEIAAIVDAMNQNVLLHQAELRLFGSRTKEDTKGGDIDLLLILSDKIAYQKVVLKKVSILIEIQRKLGEQKIDLILVTKDDLTIDPFIKLIFPSSLVLHIWK